MAKNSSTRARKANQKHQSNDLIDKLRFVAQAQKKDGMTDGHCLIAYGRIVGFDGVITVGTPIAEDITACPHTHNFIGALARCDETAAIVCEDGQITVVSGRIRVAVQCAPRDSIFSPGFEPDRQLATIDDSVRKGLEIVVGLTKEGHIRVPVAHVQLNANVMCSTDGYAAMQYYHGHDLPNGLLLPTKFCNMVVKHPSKLVGFGWQQERSVTFWFEDGSFIKTLLGRGSYPDVNGVCDCAATPQRISDEFRVGVGKVFNFSATGVIGFKDGKIWSDPDKSSVATYECDGLPDGLKLNGKLLEHVMRFADTMDLESNPFKVVFFGPMDDNLGFPPMRGVMAKNKA